MLFEVGIIEEPSQPVIDALKHPKSSLLEHAAIHRGKLSVKSPVSSGPPHQPQFELSVQYTCKIGTFVGQATAGSKKEAERHACQRIVEQLRDQATHSQQYGQSSSASADQGETRQGARA
jgi:dsRNA-specific ribonuclease